MKGAAELWIVAIVGLGFSALLLIMTRAVYNDSLQPITSGLYNTSSVATNLSLFGFLIDALPWALVIFFLAFIIAQGQKKFREEL